MYRPVPRAQCSNDSVLGAVFHPMDPNLIVTCGKSHINFWTMDGNTLTKKQGLFEVRPNALTYFHLLLFMCRIRQKKRVCVYVLLSLHTLAESV